MPSTPKPTKEELQKALALDHISNTDLSWIFTDRQRFARHALELMEILELDEKRRVALEDLFQEVDKMLDIRTPLDVPMNDFHEKINTIRKKRDYILELDALAPYQEGQ